MRAELVDVHYSYPSGVQAVRGISLAFRPGERVAIVGQNGAGKTTLAKHLNGLLRPDRGEVVVGDWDTRQHTVSELAGRVGYVFQNPDEQLFSRTVEDEIAFGPKNLDYASNRVDDLIARALSLTELQGKEKTNPYDLSPTWRKMVALASILALDAPILVLDEPTTGQDQDSIQRIARIVEALAAEGKTVIAISHDIDFCAENFGRLIALRHGQVVLDAPMADAVGQAGTLASTYVEPPQLTRLAAGLGLRQNVLTVDEFIDEVRHHRLESPSAGGESNR